MTERFKGIYRFYRSTQYNEYRTLNEAIADLERSTLEGRCSAMCVFDSELNKIVWFSDIYNLEKVLPYLPKEILDKL